MLALLCWSTALLVTDASALDPERRLSEYHHTSWGPRQGLQGQVLDIGQSPDGYLWLGTSLGLVRFDGYRFETITSLGGQTIGTPFVTGVFGQPDGGLWFGYGGLGAGHYRNGRYTRYGPEQGWTTLSGVAIGPDGATWVIANGRLARMEGTAKREVGEEWGYPSTSTRQLFVDARAQLWARTEEGLYVLSKGASKFRQLKVPLNRDSDLIRAPAGRVWVLTGPDLFAFTPGEDQLAPIRRIPVETTANVLLDKDGGLWVPGGQGLYHAGAVGAEAPSKAQATLMPDLMTPSQGMSGRSLQKLFEDKEGNVWVGTTEGLDRFRDAPLVLIRSFDRPVPVALAVARDGAVWAADWYGGLKRVQGRTITAQRCGTFIRALHRDPSGKLWCAGGLSEVWRVSSDGKSERLPDIPLSIRHDAVRALTVDHKGVLWATGGEGGNVGRLVDGRWEIVAGREGFPERWYARAMFTDRAGRLWFGFGKEIVLYENGRARRLGRDSHGLDIGIITTFHQRGDNIWVGGMEGVARFDGQRFQRLHGEDGAPLPTTSGIVETANGDLWLHGPSAALRIPAEELRQAAPDWQRRLRAERFDALDGLYGTASAGGPTPTVVEASDGRLWFSTTAGLAHLDPRRMQRPARPPQTFITALSVDGERHVLDGTPLELPPHSRQIELVYHATGLSIPERIRFRYRLDGIDTEWQDVGLRRMAFYNSLGPGRYRFRLLATDENGRWNTQESAIEFSVRPAWFQTLWFRGLCVLAGLALLWLLYRLRVSQLTARVRAKLIERERIARELHDTLLQGVQGLMITFQSIAERMPADAPAQHRIGVALERAQQLIIEGRDRVHELRRSAAAPKDLLDRLREFGISVAESQGVAFEMRVDGRARDLRAAVLQDLHEIIGEALLNACRHAQARRVHLQIDFGARELLLRVSDDGVGMDPAVLQHGRTGHWGLLGMRERADSIGARLRIGAVEPHGTEVELRLRARSAYAVSARRQALA